MSASVVCHIFPSSNLLGDGSRSCGLVVACHVWYYLLCLSQGWKFQCLFLDQVPTFHRGHGLPIGLILELFLDLIFTPPIVGDPHQRVWSPKGGVHFRVISCLRNVSAWFLDLVSPPHMQGRNLCKVQSPQDGGTAGTSCAVIGLVPHHIWWGAPARGLKKARSLL